jgi:hypothetical protein
MTIKATQKHRLSVGATRIVRVNYTDDLDSAETLVSPTVTGSSDLTLATSDVVVNSAAYVDDEGTTVAIGKAVFFSVLGGSIAASPYTLHVTASTNSTPAQVLPYDLDLYFE